MARENALTTTLGSAFLAVPLLFIAVNILEYELGVPVPWNPFESIYEGSDHTPLRFFFDALIVFGPLAGLAVLVVPLTRINWSLNRDGVAFSISVRRGGAVTLGMIAVGITAIAVLGTYVVAENLPCILGREIRC